jgi:hypothetical protein
MEWTKTNKAECHVEFKIVNGLGKDDGERQNTYPGWLASSLHVGQAGFHCSTEVAHQRPK